MANEKRELSGRPKKRIALLIKEIDVHLIENTWNEGPKWDVSIRERDEWLLELCDLVEEEFKEDRPFKIKP